jgi:hypothetical protein
VVDIGEEDSCVITPLSSWPTGHVPSQTGLSLDYGLYVFGVALNYPVHHGHATVVRLYRPGYHLIELHPWQIPDQITWTEAPDLASQEEAVNQLLRTPWITWRGTRNDRDDAHIQPGSASPGQRQTLLFAAAESERIAALPSLPGQESSEKRDGLVVRARWLRELAAQ